ncbi:MAG: hypothetical protein QXR53_02200 [Candidatus Norongarragalinales archaeon]
MMGNTVVGVIGLDDDAGEILYTGLREFPAGEVILIHTPESGKRALALKNDLSKIKIPVKMEEMRNSSLETVFQTIYKIRSNERGKKLVLNIDTDHKTSCIALSAAFVNGIQAIGVNDKGRVVAYPIMKFSYYSALSEKKLGIMRKIRENDGVESLEELGGLVKMSLPLVTYHVRGTKSAPGLEELGLVEVKRRNGRVGVMLTSLGRLVLDGYVEVECNEPQCAKKSKAKGKRAEAQMLSARV